jgi:hypothetical protein
MRKKPNVQTEEEQPEEEVIEDVVDDEIDDEDDDGEIELKEPPPQPVKKKRVITKPKTEKQLATVSKMLEGRKKSLEIKRVEKNKVEDERKEVLRQKMLKKSIALKKKQLKEERLIEDLVSDDDDDVETVKKAVNKRKTIKETVYLPAPQPAFHFL